MFSLHIRTYRLHVLSCYLHQACINYVPNTPVFSPSAFPTEQMQTLSVLLRTFDPSLTGICSLVSSSSSYCLCHQLAEEDHDNTTGATLSESISCETNADTNRNNNFGLNTFTWSNLQSTLCLVWIGEKSYQYSIRNLVVTSKVVEKEQQVQQQLPLQLRSD